MGLWGGRQEKYVEYSSLGMKFPCLFFAQLFWNIEKNLSAILSLTVFKKRLSPISNNPKFELQYRSPSRNQQTIRYIFMFVLSGVAQTRRVGVQEECR